MGKRIVLVGPVYPYKGGISHYTGLLYRALCEKYETRMISYSMQYPKLLFKKEQKDFSNDAFRADGTEYLINTANPVNILRAAGRIAEYEPDAVLIQWWHPYFAPCYRLLTGRLKKAGIKILFTCHNVFPHERFVFDRFLTKLTLSRGDGFVLHSGEEAKELLSIKRDADYRINPHPTYEAFAMEGLDRERARELLGLSVNMRVPLFFGFIREYKGLKHLIRALGILKKRGSRLLDESFVLYVVGDFGSQEKKNEYLLLMEEQGVSSYIKVVDGYVPDREVERYFAACDVVVLPYESATQSGIVQIAYGFDRPVIATRTGGLAEAVRDKETGILTEPFDEEGLAEALESFFFEDRFCEYSENIKKDEYTFSWERMVDTIGELL
ncbi:MAG: glycosyltransferase [Lachnospiraceae bacterium]|nr:glycosyltransferase [Lachnospiraceae bacterium]